MTISVLIVYILVAITLRCQYMRRPDLVEIKGHDYMTTVFVGDCRNGGLKDISQFHTPIEEEEISDRINIRANRSTTTTHGGHVTLIYI
ncbi:LOW QUALITY PROTEIN: hypothetical protein PanWU01x14_248830 [Parasponia andersonii]|uniref:Uncharacterized protein n=1 Tax=Parasponia andersonii TaxID=3476 RepID=A0A2P5BDD1_PARAD|nr:LOW QUALITY PROTEIN: hypothetical protein PanWU01x14_248830 [Parasponia andersonii]